jgi:hypothetical protein
MSNQRSPNCPQISFAEAVEKGREVYKKEHTRAAAKEVVAVDLGYKGISGASLSAIGALRQYGILEGTRESMRVTEEAVAYYELEDSPERRQATLRMAFKPSLFEEMRSEFGSSGSDANMKHWLIKKGFLPKAAEDVIRVYRENITLAAEEQPRYAPQGWEAAALNPAPSAAVPTQKPLAGIQTYAFALSPNARAELSLKGEITSDDLEMLRDHIELTIKALARSAKKEVNEK